MPVVGNDYTATLRRGTIALTSSAAGLQGAVHVGGEININNCPDITNIRSDMSASAKPQLTPNWGISTDDPQIGIANVHWEVWGLHVDWLDDWIRDACREKLMEHIPALNQSLSQELRRAAREGWQALCKDVEVDGVEQQLRIRPTSVQAKPLVFDKKGVTLDLTITFTIQIDDAVMDEEPCPPLPDNLILAQ